MVSYLKRRFPKILEPTITKALFGSSSQLPGLTQKATSSEIENLAQKLALEPSLISEKIKINNLPSIVENLAQKYRTPQDQIKLAIYLLFLQEKLLFSKT
jgi:flagellar biosynthesis component FlhA